MRFHLFFLVLIIFSYSSLTLAKEFPVKARFFVGALSVDPKDLNQEMTAQTLKEIDAVSVLGVEVTHSSFKYLDLGFRYTKRYANKDELTTSTATDYFGELDQDSVLLLARVPFFKSDIMRADVFAGVGGSNTKFKIKTATQDGELSKAESDDWYATPYSSFGASIGVGYKNYFFVLEGGVESNKVSSFKRTGTVNTNVDDINLSGSYVSFGFMIDGLTGTQK